MKHELYGTRLYVDLSQLENNINYISKITNKMKIVAMVKANAYGHGDIEVVQKMEKLGIRHFGVADFEEGVRLRAHNIKSSIMVMNPGVHSVEVLIKHNLEPVIYNEIILNELVKSIENISAEEKNKTPVLVHIKINTGMNRWGFNASEIQQLIISLKEFKKIQIKSIYSHLASSENKRDDQFTIAQINELIKIKKQFTFGLNIPIKLHIHNSFGLLRFVDTLSAFDYSRIGLALYGGIKDVNLKPISELRCLISQIRIIRKNDTVGYDQKFIAKKRMKIGVVPFGYADGLQRAWGNGGLKFYYKGSLLPTVGNISMDSCIVDLSQVQDICEGDEIIYFGKQRLISDLAKELNTIPHEIMSTLSRRIKRVYC